MSESDEIDSQLRKQRAAESSGGARISLDPRDPRLSRLFEWLQPVVSSLVVAGLLYFANKVGDLSDAIAQTNIQMALTRQQNTAMVEELKDHEGRLRTNEGDLRDLKTRMGMNLRGGEIPRDHR